MVVTAAQCKIPVSTKKHIIDFAGEDQVPFDRFAELCSSLDIGVLGAPFAVRSAAKLTVLQ
jgi:hypothetical protein